MQATAKPRYPVPLTAPPSWLPLLEHGDGGSGGGLGPDLEGAIPGTGWPAAETIDYLYKLLGLLVLVLALPWLFERLLASPRKGSHGAATLSPAAMGA